MLLFQIAKDAKECVQECVSEFISFITSEASERCAQEKRKTINGEDVLFAMASLGFDPYIEPLKVYLQKYRDVRYPLIVILVYNSYMLPYFVCATLYFTSYYKYTLTESSRRALV